jgi:hypothetical protein
MKTSELKYLDSLNIRIGIMMRNVKGYVLLALSLILTGMLTAGCTKEVQQGALGLEAGASEGDEFVYVPEFQILSTEVQIASNNFLMTQDTIYYVVTTFGENSKQLVSQSLTEVGEPTVVSLDLGTDTTVYRMICDADGAFLILVQTMGQDMSQSSFKLVKYDQTGQKLSELELPEASIGANPEYYEKYIALDEEGNLYVADNQTIWLYKQSKVFHGQIEISGNLSSMTIGKDGKVYIAYQQSTIPWLAELNFNSKSVETTYNASWGGSNAKLTTGIDSNLLYYDGSRLFEMDPETGKVSKILDWVDCNVDALSIRQVTKLTDGRIAAVSFLFEEDMLVELATIKKTLISELPDKETIVLGYLYENTYLQKQVAAFNRISDQYKVEIKPYAKSTDYDGIMEAVTIINAEIATGHAPDILLLPSSRFDLDALAKKGVFVDLNEMFANSQ